MGFGGISGSVVADRTLQQVCTSSGNLLIELLLHAVGTDVELSCFCMQSGRMLNCVGSNVAVALDLNYVQV